MATANPTRSQRPRPARLYYRPSPQQDPGCSDNTADRLRAFLASMRPLVDSDDHSRDAFDRGRQLIEAIAAETQGCDWPTTRLSRGECADLCEFLRMIEPVHPKDWWRDPEDAASHVVGFHFVLGVIEESLRPVKGERS